VEQCSYNFSNCSDRLRDAADFAKMAIEMANENGSSIPFEHCSDRLRDDEVFARLALDSA
jgi:hypothetical protein